jgi:hypothetical protein
MRPPIALPRPRAYVCTRPQKCSPIGTRREKEMKVQRTNNRTHRAVRDTKRWSAPLDMMPLHRTCQMQERSRRDWPAGLGIIKEAIMPFIVGRRRCPSLGTKNMTSGIFAMMCTLQTQERLNHAKDIWLPKKVFVYCPWRRVRDASTSVTLLPGGPPDLRFRRLDHGRVRRGGPGLDVLQLGLSSVGRRRSEIT